MFAARRVRYSRIQTHNFPIISSPALVNLGTASCSASTTLNTSSIASPTASSSKRPYASHRHGHKLVDIKGKGRAIDEDIPNTLTRSTQSFPPNQNGSSFHKSSSLYGPPQRRHFHATARRDAIPLLPASIAILKGTSILTAATAFSRILISFFPIGTIAAFKMARAGKWLERDVVEPEVSEESKEFWKMWCEDEKYIGLTKEDAETFYEQDTDYNDAGAMENNKGQVAYPVPFPHSRFRRGASDKDGLSPKECRKFSKDKRHAIHWIRKGHFFIPPLPPAAKVSWEELNPVQQNEVFSLRRYWLGLRVFKAWYRRSRWIMMIVFGLPFLVLTSVYLAGLERVPLTGRWRLILLTPEEEDTISNSLAGPNWYKSVINLLTTPEAPAPPIIPPNDWRWNWVQSTLTKLENAVLIDCPHIPDQAKSIIIANSSSTPIIPPPPAYHPISPRPRVSSRLHSVLPGGEPHSGQEHLELGPPYNLMLMEKSEENAFSYGFGGKRAGGIVVFTGLLDMLLRQKPNSTEVAGSQDTRQPAQSRGFFSSIFGSPSTPARRTPTQQQPTEEQTLQLACVLAHEMGHLLLSHHLETLSQQQVLWPSVLGLTMDLVRAFIWPFTWFLGPTVNDALANMGRTSTEELADKYGQIGFQYIHEYEADLAGLRILALAGYDPNQALSYFSTSVADLHEIQSMDKIKKDNSWTGSMFKLWTRATHPTPDQRREAIREELDRWAREAEKKRLEEGEHASASASNVKAK
ncbi:uncharacterized protein I303_104747 [Kwoniella dejecticola CBS 10117]|uniref:Peptidase M48 domain-containing protein n=1 Tax=Kwoniella dejecticola CBS 10117 TaxID=1296121 RepID=A0A1A6A4I1_9TREE|nr:uncharacterized protein I303_04273 [Kwoniella dejecticola CBS 10117]OBR84948.1 hypothetical protein I303_04273 [Kwoniella dejecticola CBS 10117]